jgi:hypothetical protein
MPAAAVAGGRPGCYFSAEQGDDVRAQLLLVVVSLLGHSAIAATATRNQSDFLIPGADFSKLTFDVGAWCRYYVADEALGVVDSTEVYLGITGRENTPDGPACWVEMETGPRGGGLADARVLKMLVLERIRSFSEGDSLGEFVLKLYSRNGLDPPVEEDPHTFQDFSLVVPTMDSTWVMTPDVSVETIAGQFSGTMKHRLVNNDSEVQTGSVRLIRQSRDDFTAWFSNQVPIFHLARCEINRIRRTETRPKMTGIPPSTRKDSKTTAELVAYGFDAQPLLEVPE